MGRALWPLALAGAFGLGVAVSHVAWGNLLAELGKPAEAEEQLRKGLALRDRSREQPLVSFCFAPHAPYTVSDATFRQIGTLAAELDLPVHMHVHETEDEIERSLAEHGVRPLERLRRLGLLEPGLMAVHCVHLDEHEIALLARHGCWHGERRVQPYALFPTVELQAG